MKSIVLAFAVAACGSEAPHAVEPRHVATEPASTPEPVAAVEPPPPTEPPPEPPVDDAAARALIDQVAFGPHTVLGRVVERGETEQDIRGRAITVRWAIVEIEDWIRGDAAEVFEPYRTRFPMYWSAFIEREGGVREERMDERRDIPVGDSRVFVLGVPGPRSSGVRFPGPPEPLRSQFDEHEVEVFYVLAAAQERAVRRAFELMAIEERTSAEEAARATATDRFTRFVDGLPAGTATTDDGRLQIATYVRDFVTHDFAEYAFTELRFRPPRIEPHPRLVDFTYQFTGRRPNHRRAPPIDGTLIVQLEPDGHVRYFRVECEALTPEVDPEILNREGMIRGAERRIDLAIEGGEPHRDVRWALGGLPTVDFCMGRVYPPTGGATFTRCTTIEGATLENAPVVLAYRNTWRVQP